MIFYLNDSQRELSVKKIKLLNESVYNNKVVTTIEKATNFWKAEEYHQKYIRKKLKIWLALLQILGVI